MSTDNNARKVTTPIFRGSFANLFEAKPGPDGNNPKFGITMLFDAAAQKSPQFAAMKALAVAAAKEKFGDTKLKADGKGWFHGLRNPFRDGAEKSDLEGYEGCVFAAATTKQQPGVVDSKVQRIIDPNAAYSGAYYRATVTAYAYEQAGNKGVAFGLQNVQKVRDGERMAGRVEAEKDFDEVDTSAFEEGDKDFMA
jgi:hypothetical protein